MINTNRIFQMCVVCEAERAWKRHGIKKILFVFNLGIYFFLKTLFLFFDVDTLYQFYSFFQD